MKLRNVLMATASLAFAACIAGSVSAQDNLTAANGARATAPAAPRSKLRHLLYIATPGDNGADDQSGVIVLDADHDYRFVARIPYGLAASEMPGPKISGMTASIPENKIYVTTDGGSLIAFDLKTDTIAWTFKGEKNPVTLQRPGSATDGCCERPIAIHLIEDALPYGSGCKPVARTGNPPDRAWRLFRSGPRHRKVRLAPQQHPPERHKAQIPDPTG